MYKLLPLYFLASILYAGPTDDNHIHIEQLSGGDNLDLTISQIGLVMKLIFHLTMQIIPLILIKQEMIITLVGFHIGVQVKAGVEMLMELVM